MSGHVHKWRKTGEYFAINPPMWVWVCDECRAVGEAHDGNPVNIKGVWSEDEYRRFGRPTGEERET